MSAINAKPIHRVKGKAAITRSLRSLLIRTHRFGRARAVTDADRWWAAQLIDRLTEAVHSADPQEPRP